MTSHNQPFLQPTCATESYDHLFINSHGQGGLEQYGLQSYPKKQVGGGQMYIMRERYSKMWELPLKRPAFY